MRYSIKSILYTSDLTPRSPVVFRHAVGLAQRFEADLHGVSVIRPGIGLPHDDLSEEHLAQIQASHNPAEELFWRRIHTFDQAHPEYDVLKYMRKVQVLDGDPAKVILDVAKEIQADLIVMGSRGHNVMEELILGSVSHKVMLKTTIPVVLVPFDRE